MAGPDLTLGNYRIGYSPDDPDDVQTIKRAAANLIDLIESTVKAPITGPVMSDISQYGEIMGCKKHAQRLIADASMNAVRALQISPPNTKEHRKAP